MSNADAQLVISAEAGGVEAAMQQAAQAVQVGVNNINHQFEGMMGVFQRVQSVMGAMTAVLAGGHAFKAAVNETVDWTKEANSLAKTLGITATQASVLNIAIGDIYQSADTVIAATQRITRTLSENEAAFSKLGVATRDQSGNYRNSLDIMLDVNQALLKFKEGTDRNIEGQKIYGKQWAEISGVLKLTTDLMEDSRQKAEALGLTVGVESVEKTAKYRAAINDLEDVFKAVNKVIGEAVMPVLTELSNALSEYGPQAVQAMRYAVAGLVTAFYGLKQIVEIVWQTIKLFVQAAVTSLMTFAEVCSHALRGDFDGAKAAWERGGQMLKQTFDDRMADIVTSAESNRDKIFKTIGEALDPKSTPTAAKGSGAGSTGGDSKSDGKEKNRASEWETMLTQEKVAYQMAHGLREMTKQEEIAWWQAVAKQHDASRTEQMHVDRKTAELQLQILKEQAGQRKAINEELVNDTEQQALDQIQSEESKAQAEFEIGRLTKSELLRQQLEFENKRNEIIQAAQEARIAAIASDPNLNPEALQRALGKQEALTRQHALSVQKINQGMAIENRNQWQQMLQPITQAIDKSITGMIMGTTTLKKAMSNIFQSIVAEFVNMTVKMLTRWVATEMAKASSTQAGAAIQVASQSEASTATLGIKAPEAMGVIGANAGSAASDAASSVASVPYIGPILAASAFAATLAMVLGAKSSVPSAAGGYDIPAGINPLTQLHEKEMVLPAKYADAIRGMAEGGGPATGDVHVHVTAMDSRDVKRFLMDNRSAVADALKGAVRDFKR